MSTLPQVRLLVGTRRDVLPDLGQAVEVIDLDSDTYTGRRDIEEYVAGVLAELPERVALARAVADRSGHSFLVARMTVRALLHGGLSLDVTRPGWENDLPSEAGQAFDAYLARYGDEEARVRRLLRPLAHAEGAGLPWDSLWAPLATALSGVPCTDEDVDWLLRKAGSYVLEVPVGDDRSVFRLYHEALAEHLRDPRRAAEDRRRMTDTLLASIPALPDGERDWERAHPYLPAYLPAHALVSGELERLLDDAWFLVHAEPAALLAAMRGLKGVRAERIQDMYRTSAHLYAEACVHERAQLLAVDAARYRVDGLRRELGRKLTWKPRWATASQTSAHFRTELAAGTERLLVATEVDGAPVVLVPERTGAVGVWDPAEERCVALLEGHIGSVTAMDCMQVNGRTLAATAARDESLRVWDVASATEVRRFAVPDHPVAALACTRLDGAPVLVGSDTDGVAWVRDLTTGEVLRTLSGSSDGSSAHIPLACLDDGTVLVGTAHPLMPRIRRWDLATGNWHTLDEGFNSYVCATHARDGEHLVALAYRDGRFRLWRPSSDEVVADYSVGIGWCTAMAFTVLNGSDAVVLGYGDGAVELRGLADGRLLGRLNGHTDWIHAIAIITVEGRPVAATASSDWSVRLWDLVAQHGPVELPGHASRITDLECTVLDGRPVSVTGSHDHTAKVWDLKTAREIQSFDSHSEWVTAVACTTVSGTPVAVTVGNDDSARLWDLSTGAERGRIDVTHDTPVACAHVSGREVALVGVQDADTREAWTAMWDLDSLAIVGTLAAPVSGPTSLTTTTVDGVPVAVIAECPPPDMKGLPYFRRVSVWDLTQQTRLGVLEGMDDQVNALACARVGQRSVAVLATVDHDVQMWDVGTRLPLCTLDHGGAWVSAIACGVLDETPVAVTAGHLGLRIWDLVHARLLDTIDLPAPSEAIAFGSSGELVVGTGYEVLVLDR